MGRHDRDTRHDPRAERRARELLRSSAGEEAHAMYVELGFIAVDGEGEGYGYLLYPHRPIVAYDARNGEPLSEYCVRFPDGSEPEGARWLPDADDVLAKWIALRGDERGLISTANLHPLGRQLDPAMVRRDLKTLQRWKRSKEVGVAG